jgi:hypothetical protein
MAALARLLRRASKPSCLRQTDLLMFEEISTPLRNECASSRHGCASIGSAENGSRCALGPWVRAVRIATSLCLLALRSMPNTPSLVGKEPKRIIPIHEHRQHPQIPWCRRGKLKSSPPIRRLWPSAVHVLVTIGRSAPWLQVEGLNLRPSEWTLTEFVILQTTFVFASRITSAGSAQHAQRIQPAGAPDLRHFPQFRLSSASVPPARTGGPGP